MTRAAIAALAAVAGCLGPLVDDTPATSPDLLPAGSDVPLADDDPEIAEEIRANQYVSGTVPLLAGFGGGVPLAAWDFGPAPDHTAPLFVLVDADGEEIDHPEIVDVAPGDPGYSPFWTVWKVPVTDRYADELITSLAALDDARALGLVGAPEISEQGELEPIVTRDVLLAAEGGQPAHDSEELFYYRGVAVKYFELGPVPLEDDRVSVAIGTRYILRREGGEPINEVIRQVDLDGDGDRFDSNDILSGVTAGIAYTPVYRTWRVVVPAATMSIDTTGDQTMADHRDARQLFDPGPLPGTVLGYEMTDELRVFALSGSLEEEEE